MPVSFPLQKPQYAGDPVEGFMMMHPGDSAVFMTLVDSLKKAGAQLMPWMKSGEKLTYNVSVVSVKPQAIVKMETEKKAQSQNGEDDKILQNYFTRNNIKANKTATGLYYSVQNPGTGDNPKPGQSVTVNYTGKNLDGKTFDSNVDSNFHHVQPFAFTLGQHQVIAGWDEGIPLFKKGGKGTLYIPSSMAYGAQGSPPAIAANAVLIFDIEVTDIK